MHGSILCNVFSLPAVVEDIIHKWFGLPYLYTESRHLAYRKLRESRVLVLPSERVLGDYKNYFPQRQE
jgi:hypothetical protein